MKTTKQKKQREKYGITVDFSDCLELAEKMKRLPHATQHAINEYLWDKAGKILEKDIYKRMPHSQYVHYSKNKPKSHAKNSSSLEQVKFNLGIKVQTRTEPKSKDFGYLIFPDEGRGIRQKKKGRQEFFNKSLETKKKKITDELLKHLNKKIEEEL